MPSGYKFSHQGGQKSCVFSSLASTLSYKGYNYAAENISSTIQGSLSFGDPMTYEASLLNNSLQVDRYTLRTTLIEPKMFSTILQITAKHAISICGNQIFDPNFHEPMQLSLDNLTRCCKNLSDEIFQGVTRGYIFLDYQVKSGRFVKQIQQAKPVKPIKQVKPIKEKRRIKEIVTEMKKTINIRTLKCLSSAFGYFQEYINQNNPNSTRYVAKTIAQDINQYKNATYTISNLKITEAKQIETIFLKVLKIMKSKNKVVAPKV